MGQSPGPAQHTGPACTQRAHPTGSPSKSPAPAASVLILLAQRESPCHIRLALNQKMLHIFSLFLLPLLLSTAEAKKGFPVFLYFCLGEGCNGFQTVLTIVSILLIWCCCCAVLCICCCEVCVRCCQCLLKSEEEQMQRETDSLECLQCV